MKKISIYSIFVFFLIIYIYSTFFYSLLPMLNKILGIFIMLIVFFMYANNFKKNDLPIIIFVIVAICSSIFNHDSLSIFVEHTVHYVTTILILWKITVPDISDNIYKYILKYNKIIKFTIVSIGIFTIMTLFLNGFYQTNSGERVYVGLSNGSHSIASISCMMIMLIIIFVKNKDFKLSRMLYMVPFVLAIVRSGSRIYLGTLLALFIIFYSIKLKEYKYNKVLIVMSAVILIILFFNSSMYTRFVATANNQYISDNKLEAISSGRLIWWKYDLNEFSKSSFLQQLFGIGNQAVFEINLKHYGMYIWAHNDFIQILLAYGIIGIILYIVFLKKIYKRIFKNAYYKKILKIVFFAIIWASFLNGFYNQQSYVFCVMLMLIAIMRKNNSIQLKGEENAE